MTGQKKLGICLFSQSDLRVSDSPLLHAALRVPGTLVLPIAILDPRVLDVPKILSPLQPATNVRPLTYVGGFPKTGAYRTRFLLESLDSLSQGLAQRLLILDGQPEMLVPKLIAFLHSKGYRVDNVYAQKESASEEMAVQSALRRRLSEGGIPLTLDWGATTLYALSDLPFDPSRSMPSAFTAFRKIIEGKDGPPVREALPAPSASTLSQRILPQEALGGMSEVLKEESLMANELVASSSVPFTYKTCLDLLPMKQLDALAKSDSRGGISFTGGETTALKRLKHYLWDTDAVKTYKDTRNGCLGMDYSTKLSPYLAHGCLSARQIYWEVKNYEKERGSNESTYWVVFELLWRDYWKFAGLKYKNGFFHIDGPKELRGGAKAQYRKWSTDEIKLSKWTQGQTGVPWVDAPMRELNATGFMSNRSRQNVASFFSLSLGLDWRLGAAYFESLLIDHDVQSNYGNWQYTAGVGTDPREYRKFNMIKQQKDYDPSGEYVQTWVDELKGRPPGDHGIFMPWEVSPVPKGYPAPLVIEPEWSKFSRKGSQQQGPHSSQKSRGKKGNNGSFTPRTSDWKIVITRKGDPKADDPKGQ